MIFSLFGSKLGLLHLGDCKRGCLWRRYLDYLQEITTEYIFTSSMKSLTGITTPITKVSR